MGGAALADLASQLSCLAVLSDDVQERQRLK